MGNVPVSTADALGLEVYPDGVPAPGPSAYCACLVSIGARGPNLDLSTTFTQWYERTFPKTAAYAQTSFTDQITETLASRCDDSYGSLSPDATPSIYVNNYGTGEGQRVPVNAIDESAFGDTRQTDAFAATCLGRYRISVRGFSVDYRGGGGCCKKFKWTAEVVVIDGLGINPGNVGDLDRPGLWYGIGKTVFGSERPAVIASWPIRGEGKCCRKSK